MTRQSHLFGSDTWDHNLLGGPSYQYHTIVKQEIKIKEYEDRLVCDCVILLFMFGQIWLKGIFKFENCEPQGVRGGEAYYLSLNLMIWFL